MKWWTVIVLLLRIAQVSKLANTPSIMKLFLRSTISPPAMQKKFYISPIFFKEAKFELNVFKRATQLTLNSPEFNYPAHKYQTRDATRKGAKGESEVEVSRRGRYPFSKRVEFSSDQLTRIRANYSKVRLHFHPVFGGQLRHFPHPFPLLRFFLLPPFHFTFTYFESSRTTVHKNIGGSMAGMACNLHRSGRLCRWLIVLFDFSARVMNRIFGGEGGGSRFERINPGRLGNLVRSPGKKLPTLGI